MLILIKSCNSGITISLFINHFLNLPISSAYHPLGLPKFINFKFMKIAICASVTFSDKIIENRKKLINLGHQVVIPDNIEEYAKGIKHPETHQELANKKISGNLIQKYFNEIKKSDAVLILNISKNNIKNYIGGNSFLEMGFAHVLNKKIYILNDFSWFLFTNIIF